MNESPTPQNSDTEAYESDAIFGGQSIRGASAPKAIFLTIPNDGPTEKTKLQKGGFAQKVGEKTYEYFQSIPAVLIFNSPIREKKEFRKGEKPKPPECQSHTGQFPSARVQNPFCRKTDAEELTQVLSKYKSLSTTKINAAVKTLIEDGNLGYCVYKDPETGFEFPVCPMARKRVSEEGDTIPVKCKPGFHLTFWDLERERTFHMSLFGMQVNSNKEYECPWDTFRKDIIRVKKPYFHYQVLLTCAKGPRDLNVLSLSPWEYVEDKAKRDSYKRMHEEAKDNWLKKAMWVPTAKEAPEDEGGEE